MPTDKTQRSRLKMMYKAGQIGYSVYRRGVNYYKHTKPERQFKLSNRNSHNLSFKNN